KNTIVIVLSLFILLVIPNCENSTEPVLYSVKYEVTGTAKIVLITFQNESAETSLIENASVPWTYNFSELKPPGTYVYLSAHNVGTGEAIVTIYRNGSVFKRGYSSGVYMAAVSGSL
ncbi:MAG: hypothetical protein Q7S39_02445, partial [Ignavibacteria bacterium]|nr:hypothetical protein [Ignavibacteria bacterium]